MPACARDRCSSLSCSLNLHRGSVVCTEIQERSKRETRLQEAHNNLQRTIQSLRYSIDVQRSSLVKVMKLLELPVSGLMDDVDMEAFVTTNMAAIELRVRDLLASADAEKVRWAALVGVAACRERRGTETNASTVSAKGAGGPAGRAEPARDGARRAGLVQDFVPELYGERPGAVPAHVGSRQRLAARVPRLPPGVSAPLPLGGVHFVLQQRRRAVRSCCIDSAVTNGGGGVLTQRV